MSLRTSAPTATVLLCVYRYILKQGKRRQHHSFILLSFPLSLSLSLSHQAQGPFLQGLHSRAQLDSTFLTYSLTHIFTQKLTQSLGWWVVQQKSCFIEIEQFHKIGLVLTVEFMDVLLCRSSQGCLVWSVKVSPIPKPEPAICPLLAEL